MLLLPRITRVDELGYFSDFVIEGALLSTCLHVDGRARGTHSCDTGGGLCPRVPPGCGEAAEHEPHHDGLSDAAFHFTRAKIPVFPFSVYLLLLSLFFFLN